ncbi:MAG: NAD(P)/FAD-dependent oxidoreductase, partial [bacterium]
GLTASIYARRALLDAVVLERLTPGGQILLSQRIENYPGIPLAISPRRLMERMQRQAENLGMKLEQSEAKGIELDHEKKIIHTLSDQKYTTLAAIIASGTEPSKLGVEGEATFVGRGVSYCATCDAPFFKDQEVMVVGGGNTALEETLHLVKFVRKAYLVHRRGMLRAEKILQERAFRNPKVEIIFRSVVTVIYGDSQVEGVELKDLETGKTKKVPCSGVFVSVGLKPNTDFIRGLIELDKKGFVKTRANLETNVPGIFACGDVRKNLLKQVVVACGEGALATCSAEKYINKVKGIEYK